MMSFSLGCWVTAWPQLLGPGPLWPPSGHFCHLSPLLQPGPMTGLANLVENCPRKKTKGSFLLVLLEGKTSSWAPAPGVGFVAQCFLPDSLDRAGFGFRSFLCLRGTRRWMKRYGIIWCTLGAELNLFSQKSLFLYRSCSLTVGLRRLEGLKIGNSIRNSELSGENSSLSAGIPLLITCPVSRP